MKGNEVKALVTGGASGLGLAVARRILADGGKVALLDVNDKAGPQIAHELGGDTCYIHTDVSSEAAVERAVAEAVIRAFKRDDAAFTGGEHCRLERGFDGFKAGVVEDDFACSRRGDEAVSGAGS